MASLSNDDFFAFSHTLPTFEGLGYAHNRLDRDTEARDETTLERMMAAPGARFYLFDGDQVVMRQRDDRLDPLFCLASVERLGGDMDSVILLGTDPDEDNAPRLATRLKGEAGQALDEKAGYCAGTVRDVGLKALLPPDQVGAVAQATSLLHWHDTQRYCSKCGALTQVALSGARRDCPSCSSFQFPRTDPVVIMLAIHRDEAGIERCLLGHHTRFDSPMYSTLAGYMEQGETLEHAVRREIEEEAGIAIGAVQYLTSQPWPFPSSLMLGCFAEALSSEISIDPTELTNAGWFTRDQVREMLSRDSSCGLPHIPGRFSIAAWLIRYWVDAG
ncbi:NAD+ diphosphatase [Cohaesibacter sp. ES.047]|uniref:NAD(+) diphosphatase n=1 Tax=Cohaesibacter sp. ES.047 TaxID=1798205 RepID=UPI000BBF8CEB|nr:NAD(+) diphosphatase [Cohaesibacter sp. ES.047]SNY91848.1 NAD+ diphosphatase [Cohaesibacter sp. ES.047]